MRLIKQWRNVLNFSIDKLEFIPNGVGRKYSIIDDHPLRKEAFNCFGYTNLLDEPIYKNFIGINYLPEAHVHYHKDPAPLNYSHVRCNWMISKPKFGGNPIINGQELHIEPGDLWICYASEEMHGSTKISEGIRTVLSFGALISLKEIINNLKTRNNNIAV